MKKLIKPIRITSRTGKTAHILGIDLETKTVKINTNKGIKEITFLTAASYKLDSDKGNQTLTPKLLTALYNPNEAQVKFPSPAKEGKKLSKKKISNLEAELEKIVEDNDKETADEADTVPYGTFTTIKPNPEENLKYIPDLAEKIGCTQKNLRKRLRKLETLGHIVKTNHTWCWDSETFDSIVAMLKDKIDTNNETQE